MSQNQDSNVTRRSFLKWSLVAGGALAALPLLEACSSRSSQQAAAPPAATTAAPPAAADALTASGFDPARRTAWLCEGTLVYLERDEALSLGRDGLGQQVLSATRLGAEGKDDADVAS